jgi:predicted small lipoprotein YifL
MAKSRATDWKFLTLLVAGLVLAGSLTGCGGKSPPEEPEANEATPPLAGVEPAAPAGPAYSKSVTVPSASSEQVYLSGDAATGWALSPSGSLNFVFTKLSDGSVTRKMSWPQNGVPSVCGPSGELAVHYKQGPRQWVSVYRMPNNRATQFTPYPDDKVDPFAPPGGNSSGGLVLCRVLDDERLLTVHANGGFDVWSPDGERLGGQAAEPADPKKKDGRPGMTLSVTPDNRTLARANADGFTIFDVPAATERVKTEPLSAVEPDRKLRWLLGTALRADGSRLAAVVMFPTRDFTPANPFPVKGDYRDHLWLVTFDTATGKRLSAAKLKQSEGVFDQLGWWGDRHVIVNRAAYDGATGEKVATFAQLNGVDFRHDPFGPDDRYWAIVTSSVPRSCTVVAVAPPDDLPKEGTPVKFTVTESGLQRSK